MAPRFPGVPRCGGFSLVEMLVVLVIVGLTTTLLIQGFFQVEALRGRITDRLAQAETRAAAAAWFRESVRAVHAHPVPEFPAFTGTAEGFLAVTHAPVAGRAGQAIAVRWTLAATDDGRIVLEYAQGEELRWPVLTLAEAGDEVPAFRYVAHDGRLLDAWPEADALPGVVPAAVILSWQRRGAARLWAVPVQGRVLPRVDYGAL